MPPNLSPNKINNAAIPYIAPKAATILFMCGDNYIIMICTFSTGGRNYKKGNIDFVLAYAFLTDDSYVDGFPNLRTEEVRRRVTIKALPKNLKA